MQFSETELPGVYSIATDIYQDFRGDFYRAWCTTEFADAGLDFRPVQMSVSVTKSRNTVRGLHFQQAPSREGKLVRCISGAIFDVAVDIRPDSPCYGRHVAVRLEGHDGKAIFIPPGFAHGFQSLTDDAQILYMMSDDYDADLSHGVRWDDPDLAIAWPLRDPQVNERDGEFPTLAMLGE